MLNKQCRKTFGTSGICKVKEISESASYGSFGNFRNYQIFRNNEAFRSIIFKISEISVISFFGSLNTAAQTIDKMSYLTIVFTKLFSLKKI
jgi:hypothetical protein